MTLPLKFYIIFLFFAATSFCKQKNKSQFELPDALGGGKTGWFNAKELPTSIKINEQWVLPRGGTMEWLMSKGYVPDSKNKNVMTPNPFDKRYKKPRVTNLPSLATNPLEYIYAPKPKRSNDPFNGLASPMKPKYSPIKGVKINTPNQNRNVPKGPLLDPDLPTLKNSPFEMPENKNLPIKANNDPDPFNQPQKQLPPNDPFAEDILNKPIKNPFDNNQELPGKKIIPLRQS